MLNRGVVYRWSSSVPSNAPLSYAAMIVYKIGPTNYAQFCISRTWGDRHAMLKRVLKDNNEWSPWQRIYDEGILNDSAILSPLASALGGKSNRLLITKYVDFSSSSTWKEDFYTYYKNELSAYMPYSIVIHGSNWDMVLFGLKCTDRYGFFISLTPYQSEFKYIDIHDGALYDNTGK